MVISVIFVLQNQILYQRMKLLKFNKFYFFMFFTLLTKNNDPRRFLPKPATKMPNFKKRLKFNKFLQILNPKWGADASVT